MLDSFLIGHGKPIIMYNNQKLDCRPCIVVNADKKVMDSVGLLQNSVKQYIRKINNVPHYIYSSCDIYLSFINNVNTDMNVNSRQ